MTHDVTLLAAALAGLLSFLSPCVLPLVPPYLTFIAGTTIEEVATRREARARHGILLAAVLFIFGFSTVFVGLGAMASAFGHLLHKYFAVLSLVAGGNDHRDGLAFFGRVPVRSSLSGGAGRRAKAGRNLGAYIMGLAFGFGWTPCIGPILTAIYVVAASEETVGKGIALRPPIRAGSVCRFC